MPAALALMPLHRSLLIYILALIGLAAPAAAQQIAWQDVFAHPRNPVYGPPLNSGVVGTALFSDGFVAICLGLAFDNPILPSQRQSYIRYYDYQGNMLNEDTIGGMVYTTLGTRLTDSSFVVLTGVNFRGPTEPIYDTGQIGGYVLRGYHKSGRLLWQQRRRVGSRSFMNSLQPAGSQRFALVGNINQDRRGRDSSLIEFYDMQGRYQYEVQWPLERTANFGWSAIDASPFRFYAIRSRPTRPGRWMHETIVADSNGQVIRQDPLGESAYSFIGHQAIVTPLADKGYVADLAYQFFNDSIRTHRFYVNAVGQVTGYQRLDSQMVESVAMADGGEIQALRKYPTNRWARLDTLRQQGWPTGRGSYAFRRLDASHRVLFSVDVSYWMSDSINIRFRPAGSIPGSPEDALITGLRSTYRTNSEPRGESGLVGRINGIGRLYDPTGLRGPQSGPRVQVPLTAWPSPTEGPLRYGPAHLPCQVLDGMGRVVAQGREGQADLSALPPGLYTLRLGDGRHRSVIKN